MSGTEYRIWQDFIANARCQVSIAEYSKVGRSWRELDFVPDFNRLYLIEEGEGLIRIEDEELYPTRGQLVLMPAGIRQSFSTISDNTFGKYWCHFTAEVGELRLFDVMKAPNLLTVQSEEEWQRWISLFRSLRSAMCSSSLASRFRIQSLMLEMIASYVEQAPDIAFAPASGAVDNVNTIIRLMEHNLDKTHTVEELAKLIHYHPNYFIRVFKQFTGKSPIQYMNGLRIERAKQWLSATELSVSDIAGRIGMTLFYFSRLFKEHTGFTPSGYRQMHRGDGQPRS